MLLNFLTFKEFTHWPQKGQIVNKMGAECKQNVKNKGNSVSLFPLKSKKDQDIGKKHQEHHKAMFLCAIPRPNLVQMAASKDSAVGCADLASHVCKLPVSTILLLFACLHHTLLIKLKIVDTGKRRRTFSEPGIVWMCPVRQTPKVSTWTSTCYGMMDVHPKQFMSEPELNRLMSRTVLSYLKCIVQLQFRRTSQHSADNRTVKPNHFLCTQQQVDVSTQGPNTQQLRRLHC